MIIKLGTIMMILMLILPSTGVAVNDSLLQTLTLDEANGLKQGEIDHLYYFIGGARRCQLLTVRGKQGRMKTIVDFQRLHEQQANDIKSAEDFITLVAANDLATGIPNIMECRKNGEKIKTSMHEWLQTELISYRSRV